MAGRRLSWIARLALRPSGAKEPKIQPRDGKCQLACKPGSVPAACAAAMAIHLGRLLPDASSNQPGRRCENAFRSGETPPLCRPYSVLLPAGFTLPRLLPAARCALTAPFHPYQFDGLVLDALRPQVAQSAVGQQKGGLLSVALSLGSPPPDVIRRRVSVEPGLSSTWGPCFNRERPQRTSPKQRPSGQLALTIRAEFAAASSALAPGLKIAGRCCHSGSPPNCGPRNAAGSGICGAGKISYNFALN